MLRGSDTRIWLCPPARRAGLWGGCQSPGGQAPASGAGFVYDVQVDSKGNVWASVQALGLLIRLDPATGETKIYYPPDTPSIKGLAVDAQDNIWFAGFQGNRLGSLNPKTGTFKLHQAPTGFATPYGLAFDKKTGYIWYADLNGNNISRFDPKTEQFAEYPIPSSNASPRFIALDSKGRAWVLAEMSEEFQRGLDCLGDETLRKIALAWLEGRTYAEIAAELQIAPDTVERKLRRIRSIWRQEANQ